MRRNFVTKTFKIGVTNWTAPAGVRVVRVLAQNTRPVVAGGGDSGRGFMLDPGGNAWGWGYNGDGSLGNGLSTGNMSSPVRVGIGNVYTSLSGNGGQATVAIDTAGVGSGWGQGDQIGAGDMVTHSVAVATLGNSRWRQLSSNVNFTIGLDTNGNAWMLGGTNSNGEGGTGDIVARSSPVITVGGRNFSQIATTQQGTLALDYVGNLYTWGLGVFSGATSSPVLFAGAPQFTQIAGGVQSAYGIDLQGNLWAWGQGASGVLGTGNVLNQSTPVHIAVGTKFMQVSASAGFSVGALDTSGNLWMWGDNSDGALGTNDTVNRSTPTLVAGGNQWSFVVANFTLTIGVDRTGQVWAWGSNTFGQLGDGTLVSRSSPVKVLGPLRAKLSNPPVVTDLPVVPGQVYPVVIGPYTTTFGGAPVGTAATQVTLVYRE